jgi:hypothetical protein
LTVVLEHNAFVARWMGAIHSEIFEITEKFNNYSYIADLDHS